MRIPTTKQVAILLILAGVFWAVIFGYKLINFWLGISAAAAILAIFSIRFAGLPVHKDEIHLRTLLQGCVSAVVLYAIFGICYFIAPYILPFAQPQVADIYTIRQQAHPVLIALALVLITSPSEEIFWRGFLQRWTMHYLGETKGWILAALLYAAVHISSGNLMLTGAALVAGLFWGRLYMRSKSLLVCIVSHALWTVGIFILFPMQ